MLMYIFCINYIVSYISISILGDLVDARTKDLLGSKQFEKEWEMYQQVLNETGVTNNTIWLDIRGNHGNFILFYIINKVSFIPYLLTNFKEKKNNLTYNSCIRAASL